jgi:hypothetical protein
MNEIQVQNQTASEIRAQVNLIQEVMKAVMKPETHYGVVPGTKKPTLLKAGSEVLLTTFKISVEPEVIDLSTPDEAKYRVLAKGIHRESGTVVGVGVGECSSNEEKYKWRKAICIDEWNGTPENRRREKWQKDYGNNGFSAVKQIRMEVADVANTVLKMAKKRAQIDLTLTATAASDIFTQDVEDMPAEYLNNGDLPKKNSQAKSGQLSEAQVKRFYSIYKKANVTDEVVKFILDLIIPNNRNEEGKFDWNNIDRTKYDYLCKLFETGEWRKVYEQNNNFSDSATDLNQAS